MINRSLVVFVLFGRVARKFDPVLVFATRRIVLVFFAGARHHLDFARVGVQICVRAWRHYNGRANDAPFDRVSPQLEFARGTQLDLGGGSPLRRSPN